MLSVEYVHMRIGIDARLYGPKQGGLGRYIEQLITHLEKIDTQNEYVVFLCAQNYGEYTPKNKNFSKILADVPWYGWQEQIKLPGILHSAQVDLMHFPHWNVPFFYNQPFVVTIHDLILLHHPSRQASTLGPIKYFFKNIAYKIILNHTAKKAKKVITVSEFSKKDIVETLKISADKISVTYLAPTSLKNNNKDGNQPASAPYGAMAGEENYASDINSIREKYKITKPYLLYVGVAYPHKNLERLVQAWEIFQNKYGQNYQLVLVGKTNYFYNRLNNFITQTKIQDVILTDFVPDNEQAELYRHAALYVFPSLYEGFGLPPLEAMQYQIPVLSSQNTCLPEILGNSALYFDPINTNEIAEKIHTALTDENLRTTLVLNGQKLLPKYSWNDTATKTLQIYQTTL